MNMFTKYTTAAALKSAKENPEMATAMATIEACEALIEETGYTIEESISGYYRLVNQDGNAVIDDAACEDYEERDIAVRMFASYIMERSVGSREKDEVNEKNIESLLEGACGDSAIGNIELSILDRDDEVTLYKVEGEGFITACLQYVDEPTAIFFPDDWQGYYPETIADLEDVSWLYYNGGDECSSAVMLNGKPRIV